MNYRSVRYVSDRMGVSCPPPRPTLAPRGDRETPTAAACELRFSRKSSMLSVISGAVGMRGGCGDNLFASLPLLLD
ncbi:hypothetical protein E2C01_042641 [Portunus trituberculatus]|uniref:Uncharacterized protein n=1 Tax=Portunus trituberculatus TaxID=210409 RepID=A0A5B7FTK0_PORTR|nr:hypothetical protein [Portunus trituberculatus]